MRTTSPGPLLSPAAPHCWGCGWQGSGAELTKTPACLPALEVAFPAAFGLLDLPWEPEECPRMGVCVAPGHSGHSGGQAFPQSRAVRASFATWSLCSSPRKRECIWGALFGECNGGSGISPCGALG